MIGYIRFCLTYDKGWDSVLKEASTWQESLNSSYKIISIVTEREDEKYTLNTETNTIEYTYEDVLIIYYIKY